MASCNLLWRHPFRLSLVTIGYYLFQTLIYFISLLTHKSSSRGCIINHLSVWSQSIVKELNLQQSRKPMMWDFPNQALIPLSCFKNTFRFKLRKCSKITSEFSRFWWGKYFVRNLFAISSLVAIVFFGKELKHVLLCPLKRKEKFQFDYLHWHTINPLLATILRELAIYSFRSSFVRHPNWPVCCTICINPDFSSKLFTWIVGGMMHEVAAVRKGTT